MEHIAPDALGCPANFVLRQGVCGSCNHRNGRLDRALLTPFEIITVLKGIPRKKGRKPTVDGFSSFASGYDENGPVFFINGETHPIKLPNGKTLKGTTSDDPIQNIRWVPQMDGTVKISYDQQLRFDRKAVRGLFKIALESVAFFEGLPTAHNNEFDDVRRFVKDGGGCFRAMMMADQNDAYESYFHAGAQKDGFPRVVGMTLLGVGFVCDFDPEFRGGKLLMEEAKLQSHNVQVVPNWPKQLWIKNNAAQAE